MRSLTPRLCSVRDRRTVRERRFRDADRAERPYGLPVPTSVLWLRRDLRLRDNPALRAALAAGETVPLFVLDLALWGPAGAPRRAWLVRSLHALDDATGGALLVRHGDPATVVPQVAAETQA